MGGEVRNVGMALTISLLGTFAGRPPGLGAGIKGSRIAHSTRLTP